MIPDKSVQVFRSTEFGNIRVYAEADGKTEFCAVDVAKALGYTNPNKAIRDHTRGERNVHPLQTTGGLQNAQFLKEGDVYRLIAHSQLPSAERFESWVFDEVLPSIRKDGAYVVATEQDTDETLMAKAILAAQRALERAKAQLQEAAPKVGYFDAVMDGKSLESVTEVARHIYQYDHKTTRDSLTQFLKTKGLLTHDRQATKYAVERGYLLNTGEAVYTDPYTGEQKKRKPYGKITPKGKAWLIQNIVGDVDE